MAISITCPECRRPLKVADTVLGKKVKCPGCGDSFVARAERAAGVKPVPKAVRTPESVHQEEDRRPATHNRRPRELPQKGGGSNTALIIVLSVVGLLLLTGGGLTAYFLTHRGDAPKSQPEPPVAAGDLPKSDVPPPGASKEPDRPPPDPPKKPEPPSEDRVLNAEDLCDSWPTERAFPDESTRTAWKKKYLGQSLEIRGTIDGSGTTDARYCITLQGCAPNSFLYCHFASPPPARALKVEKGQILWVRGKCKEGGRSIILEECEVLYCGWGLPPKEEFRVGAARPALRLTGKTCISLWGTNGQLLDVNKDFTIEMWVRLPREEKKWLYLAGDEAWPDMSPAVQASCSCGWVLRTSPVEGKGVALDFTVGAEVPDDPKGEWFSVRSEPIEVSRELQHVAVCRSGDTIRLFWGGRLQAMRSCAGRKLVQSFTKLYLGPRQDGHLDRVFNGEIGDFRLSSVARYKGEFSPPDSFSADGQTLLLLDFSVGKGMTIPNLIRYREVRGNLLIDEASGGGGEWVRLKRR